MGRIIKFRVWHEFKKEMLPVTKLEFRDGTLSRIIAGDALDFMPDEDVLMQFTGLLDCKGKEIYEGDILEAGEYWGEQDYATVLWNDRQLQWYLTRNGILYEPLRTPFADGLFVFEIIGNIYENQDLLPNHVDN